MGRHEYPEMCSAPGCARHAQHRSPDFLCALHWQRLRKHGVLSPVASSRVSARPEYRHWINMKSRCANPSSTGFEHYGGRGIRVCAVWEASFEAFLRDMGPRPGAGYSIERNDVNGDYCPGNCRWATSGEQSRNKRSNHLVMVQGRETTLVDAVDGTGLKYNTVLCRLRRGWSVERAISIPTGARSCPALSNCGSARPTIRKRLLACALGSLRTSTVAATAAAGKSALANAGRWNT